jgi:hypothetical protein
MAEEMQALRTTERRVSRLQLELDGCALLKRKRSSVEEILSWKELQELGEQMEQKNVQQSANDEHKQHMDRVDSSNLKGEERVEDSGGVGKEGCRVIQGLRLCQKQSTTEERIFENVSSCWS